MEGRDLLPTVPRLHDRLPQRPYSMDWFVDGDKIFGVVLADLVELAYFGCQLLEGEVGEEGGNQGLHRLELDCFVALLVGD
eukprot:CAMPEP_0202961008 /NCGR_PEP_ID=MMETSP1396-20130829/5114_1 /ASSEMBLY_ACC=CAM_ASM_000872 /TAXON_ID= /ORGANISM="Pseudokeronopsis sp., Strain Brazil" /LENGTH=80 /DNA_ID=CAMNT_0049680565 /DNA_START=909 /DNA_END=1151 /DNA_ORIENTATION=-